MKLCKKLPKKKKRQQEDVKPGFVCYRPTPLCCCFSWLWLPCRTRHRGDGQEGALPSGGAAPGPVGPGAPEQPGKRCRRAGTLAAALAFSDGA